MLGAIVGDVVGSPFEFDRNREVAHSKQFPLVSTRSYVTDDSIMTLAMALAVTKAMPQYGNPIDADIFQDCVIDSMRSLGQVYPYAGYGSRFHCWLYDSDPKPYGSWGNGSAMRVSPVAWAFDTLDKVEEYAGLSASVTHNHPEGIKGAQATAGAIFLARTAHTKKVIKEYVVQRYGYDLDRTLDDIRPDYWHKESCQETVPEAIIAFLESTSFEDALRCAVSLSGDSDTLTAITGSIAEGYYGIPDEISKQVLEKLDRRQTVLLGVWEEWRAISCREQKEAFRKRILAGEEQL